MIIFLRQRQDIPLPSPAQLAQINQQLTQEIQQRQQTEAILRDREQRFRAIFNQTFQFMGLLTPEGKLLEANQRSPLQPFVK
ncbi:hypothetical protein [Coleofasciculus chthonoplastes]|uniref:hypothetical protein n=1 Tax=Coleofasciculus chthonoplastes TaxID=64178 RepID=UPI0032FDC7F6